MAPPRGRRIQTASSIVERTWAMATQSSSRWAKNTRVCRRPAMGPPRADPGDPPLYHARPHSRTTGPGRSGGGRPEPPTWTTARLLALSQEYDRHQHHRGTCEPGTPDPNMQRWTYHQQSTLLPDASTRQLTGHRPLDARRRLLCHAHERRCHGATARNNPTGTRSATHPHRRYTGATSRRFPP